MSNKPVLAVFLLATVGIAAGSAWAVAENSHENAEQAMTMKDFGKLSAAGATGYRDVKLARLAIFDGQTAKAKTYADDADQLFAKAKTDDTAFIKAHDELMTADQMAARRVGAKAAEPQSTTKASGETNASGAKIAWLPVDGAMDIDENYTLDPAKTKAVGEANKSLAKGDRNGALQQLKLAGIDTSIVVEVVPRDQTISDVHEAAQMIDAGKYYEGSQMLRKVQTAARFDVTDIVATPKNASGASSQANKTDPKAAETKSN